MNSDILQSILEEDLSADELIKNFPNDINHIREFREKKLAVLREIMTIYGNALSDDEHRDNLKLYKTGIRAACQIAETRIDEITHEDYQIVQPDEVSDETRRICVDAYEELKKTVHSCDRMYIPERIEKTPPDKDALIALQRWFDGARAQEARSKTANNKQFNLLFGSRG